MIRYSIYTDRQQDMSKGVKSVNALLACTALPPQGQYSIFGLYKYIHIYIMYPLHTAMNHSLHQPQPPSVLQAGMLTGALAGSLGE